MAKITANYEAMYILDPSLSEEAIAALVAKFKAVVDRFGGDPAAMRQAGVAYATGQIIDLIANGVNHIHVFTMNKPEVAQGIHASLSELLK